MQDFAEKYFRVFPNEFPKLFWIGSVCFVLFFVTALFRNFVDTTFLKRYGPDSIPLMLVINASVTVAIFGVTDRLLKLFPDRIILSYFLILSALLAPVFNYMIQAGSITVYPIIYQLMLLLDSVLFVHIWNMAGDMFDARQGKRTFPLITASQLLGTVLGSFSTAPLVSLVGENHVLLIFALIYMMVGLYLIKTGGHVLGSSERLVIDGQKSSARVGLSEVPGLMKKYPIIKFLIITGLIPNILLPIFFFQFNIIANSSFANEQSLLTFFSIFRGMTTLVTFFLLFFSSNLLSLLGLPNASLLFSFNFAALFAVLPNAFNIFVAAYGQFSTILIQRAVAGPVNKILYSIVPPDLQTWSRTFIRGSVLKIGMLAGSIFMFVSKPFIDVRDLSYVGLFLSLVMLVETFKFRSLYRSALKQVLTHQDAVQEETGSQTNILFGHFSTNEGLVNQTIELPTKEIISEPISIQDVEQALELINDDGSQLRIDAITFFSNVHDFRAVRKLVSLLSDPDDRVRSAAIDALRRYPKKVLPFLEASLITTDLRAKQGILEVIRLSYSINEFENNVHLNLAMTEVYTNLIYVHRLSQISPNKNTKALIQYLLETNEDILRLIFYALWVYHSDMRLMYDAIKSDKAAIAVELLESMVRKDVAAYLVPLLEDLPIERKIELGRSMLLLIRDDTIVRTLTLLSQSGDPLTRLLAVTAIADVWPEESLIPVVETCLFDVHKDVRKAARILWNPTSDQEEKMINTVDLIEKFRLFPIFEGMTIRELHALATVTEITNFDAGEIILKEGSENFSIYLITSGMVRVYKNYNDPKQTLKFSIGSGSFLGFVGMFTNLPVEVTCVAEEPTETFVLPQSQFQGIIRVYPQIAVNLCRFCAMKFKEFFDI